MTTTETVLEPAVEIADAEIADAEAVAISPAPSRATTRALGLWAVVGSLLAYGVLQTALKASALFG